MGCLGIGVKIFFVISLIPLGIVGLVHSCKSSAIEKEFTKEHKVDLEFKDLLYPLETRPIVCIVTTSDELSEAQIEKYNTFIEDFNKEQDAYNRANPKNLKTKKIYLSDIKKSWKRNMASAEVFLSKQKGIILIDRQKLDEVKKEYSFQLSDWSDAEKTAEIGKALNADVLISIDFSFHNEDFARFYFSTLYLEFTNMQTFQKLVYENNMTFEQSMFDEVAFQSLNLNALASQELTKSLPDQLTFDNYRKSALKYTDSTREKISPFLRQKEPLHTTKIKTNYDSFDNIQTLTFDTEQETCRIVKMDKKGGEREINGSFTFRPEVDNTTILIFPEDQLSWLTTNNISFSKKSISRPPTYWHELWNPFSDMPPIIYYESFYTTHKIGKLTIYDENNKILYSGDVYNYGREYAFHLGSDKEDGTGRQYFAFFNGN